MSRFDGRVISGVGVFAAAVETGSFVRTSDVVGLTTSGVSRAIGRLEERLGVRLFERTSQGIRVTEQGRRFYERTLPLIEQLAESASAMRSYDEEIAGPVRLHADSASSVFLLPAIKSFIEAHPNVTVQFDVRERPSDLASDSCDIAVHLGEMHRPNMTRELLFESEAIVCASPSYLRGRSVPSDPSALLAAPHSILLHEGQDVRRVPWVFRSGTQKIIIEASRKLSFNTLTMILAAALQGSGIAKLPMFMVAVELEQGDLLRLLDGWHAGQICTYIYSRSGCALSRRAQALIEHLKDAGRVRSASGTEGLRQVQPVPGLVSTTQASAPAVDRLPCGSA